MCAFYVGCCKVATGGVASVGPSGCGPREKMNFLLLERLSLYQHHYHRHHSTKPLNRYEMGPSC